MRSKCFGKELPSLSNFIQTKSVFGWARKGLGTSFALECYAWFRGSGFPSKIAYVKTGDKGKLFILFLPLFTLSLLSKIVCSLWIHHSRVKQQWDLPQSLYSPCSMSFGKKLHMLQFHGTQLRESCCPTLPWLIFELSDLHANFCILTRIPDFLFP